MDNNQKPANYALNGKIMLCSVIILFVVACFHSSVRLCFHRNHPHRRRRRSRRIFSQNNIISSTTSNVVSRNKGLDLSILKTLPSFVYSTSAAHDPLLECAVCLSEIEDGERGRVLPNCKHAFHIECIDTWFESNSNCPLCRCLVGPDVTAPMPEVVITVNEEPAGSGSEEGEDKMGSPSVRFSVEECGRKPLDLVGMAMEDRARDFRWPQSYGGKCSGDQIVSMKRIWSI